MKYLKIIWKKDREIKNNGNRRRSEGKEIRGYERKKKNNLWEKNREVNNDERVWEE